MSSTALRSKVLGFMLLVCAIVWTVAPHQRTFGQTLQQNPVPDMKCNGQSAGCVPNGCSTNTPWASCVVCTQIAYAICATSYGDQCTIQAPGIVKCGNCDLYLGATCNNGACVNGVYSNTATVYATDACK